MTNLKLATASSLKQTIANQLLNIHFFLGLVVTRGSVLGLTLHKWGVINHFQSDSQSFLGVTLKVIVTPRNDWESLGERLVGWEIQNFSLQ